MERDLSEMEDETSNEVMEPMDSSYNNAKDDGKNYDAEDDDTNVTANKDFRIELMEEDVVAGPSSSTTTALVPVETGGEKIDLLKEIRKIDKLSGRNAVQILDIGGGKYIVPVNKLIHFIKLKKWSLPVACLTTSIKKSPFAIHPLIDVDYSKKAPPLTMDERFSFGKQFVRLLNKMIPGCDNWMCSTRPGEGGGIHLYHLGVNLDPIHYRSFVNYVAVALGEDEYWKVDVNVSNVTLPYSGKKSSHEYVYRNEMGKPDPFLWCCEPDCRPLKVPSAQKTLVAANNNNKKNNVADDEDDSPSNFVRSYGNEVRKLKSDLFSLCHPVAITSENALFFLGLRPDYDNPNDLYLSAGRAVADALGHRKFDMCQNACIAEYFQTDCKELLVLNGENRSIAVCEAFVHRMFAAFSEKRDILVNLLMAYQFPMVVRSNGYDVFTGRGWRREGEHFLDVLLDTMNEFLSKRFKDIKYNIPKITKKFMETFWDFQALLDFAKRESSYKKNHVVCSSDHYLYAKGEGAFVKASVLHPHFVDSGCIFTRKELEEGRKLYDDTYNRVCEVFENCDRVGNGEISLYELFGNDQNFLDCPILGCAYFLVTYFGFRKNAIYKFLNIMHSILFGKTKQIVWMVGASGDNGKTTLSILIHRAFGNTSGVFNETELVNKSAATSPDFVANASKKVCLLDESGRLKLDPNIIKRLTSGGYASSRTLYQENKVIQCLANFICYGNQRPKLFVDEALKKRITLFELNSVFKKMDVLTKHQYFSALFPKHDNRFFMKLHLDCDKLGFGFLLMILYMKKNYVVEEEVQFEMQDPVEMFEEAHIDVKDRNSVDFDDVVTVLKKYAAMNEIHEATLVREFCEKHKKKKHGSVYRGFDLCNVNAVNGHFTLL